MNIYSETGGGQHRDIAVNGLVRGGGVCVHGVGKIEN